MPSSQTPDFDIRQVAPADRAAALGQLMAEAGARADLTEAQVAAYADRLGVDFAHLWSYHGPDGLLVGPTVLIVLRPGRTGMVFTSPLRRRCDVPVMSRIVRHAVAQIKPDKASMLQVLIEPDEDLLHESLTDAGFAELAMLDYLQRSVPRQSRSPNWPADVTIESFERARIDDFAAALEASYEQTLDCPMLCGMRRTSDVIAGHMSAGRFEPNLWTLLRIQGRPSGVLLLAPIDQQDCIELVYLGLAREARGRGLVSMLIELGLNQSLKAHLPVMTLAVDRLNKPVMRLYLRHGFYRVARRGALVLSVCDPGHTARH